MHKMVTDLSRIIPEREEGGEGGGVRAETDGSVYSPPTVDHNH
jgi:hypothetical protein